MTKVAIAGRSRIMANTSPLISQSFEWNRQVRNASTTSVTSDTSATTKFKEVSKVWASADEAVADLKSGSKSSYSI